MEQRLKEIKDVLNISENEFARRLGMSQSTLNSYTLGKRKPSFEFAENLLNTFVDISAEWLLRREGPMLISDIPSEGDVEKVLELKAEITRLRATIAELRDENQRINERTDKLIDILYRDDEPQRKKA